MRSSLDTLRRDLKIALRNLRRRPGFAFTAIATLAVGIGAVVALVSVVQTTLLGALPFPAPERLVSVDQTIDGEEHGGNPVRLADLAAGAKTIAAVGGYYGEGVVWLRSGEGVEPERLRALCIYGDLLDLLAAAPIAGRTFTANELRPDSRALLLSELFWRTRLGADPAAVGRPFRLGDQIYTVVGVLPGSVGDTLGADLVVAGAEFTNRKAGFLKVIARLADGVSLPAARTAFSALGARMAKDHADTDAGIAFGLTPAVEELTGTPLRAPLLMVLATAGFVLLIVCVNLACLMLSRAPQAIREGSIRAALGAGRGSLLRTALTESLVLAAIGGGLGLLLAAAGVRLLASRLPADLPNVRRLGEIGLDSSTVAVALALTLLCGLLFGLAPAWRVAHRSTFVGLRGRTAGDREGGFLRSGLVVVELALSLVLLIGAGLTGQTLLRLEGTPLGFVPERLLTLRIDQSWDTPQEKLNGFYRDLLAELAAIPGVRSAAFADRLPFEGESQGGELALPGRTFAQGAKTTPVSRRAVSADYFSTVGTPLLAGTGLKSQSAGKQAVVNDAFARRYLGVAENRAGAIGQTFGLNGRSYEIVGVVADLRQTTLQTAVPPEVFTLYDDTFWAIGNFVIRAEGRPEALAAAVRAAVRRVDPTQVIDQMESMETQIHAAYAAPRTTASLVGGFSIVALLLAAIGLYGVLASDVEARRREFGVRMALGATPQSILRRAILRGALLAALGVAFGLAGGIALRRAITSLLYASGPSDFGAFAVAALVLFVVALLAADGPARRASKVDPAVALRAEF